MHRILVLDFNGIHPVKATTQLLVEGFDNKETTRVCIIVVDLVVMIVEWIADQIVDQIADQIAERIVERTVERTVAMLVEVLGVIGSRSLWLLHLHVAVVFLSPVW
jgi:uncharacterized membrane protein (Fun14 family)